MFTSYTTTGMPWLIASSILGLTESASPWSTMITLGFAAIASLNWLTCRALSPRASYEVTLPPAASICACAPRPHCSK